MEKQVIIIEANREGYGIDQIRETMTAGEIIDWLSQYDEETPVYLSHDNGYTFGGIRERDFTDDWVDDEDE